MRKTDTLAYFERIGIVVTQDLATEERKIRLWRMQHPWLRRSYWGASIAFACACYYGLYRVIVVAPFWFR